MNILILGTGKMSRALQTAFAPDHRVVAAGRARFDAAAQTGLRELLDAERPDLVCNTVVLGGIDACEADVGAAYAVNTAFPARLAELSRERGFRLLHISSDAVFGDAAPGAAFDERSLPAPRNAYGLTKFGADARIPALTDDFLILRLPLLFGPCDTAHQFFEKMLKLGLERGALSVSNDVFSSAAYSLDVAWRARQLVEAGAESGLYHVAGAEACSLYDLVAEGVALLDLPVRVEPVSHTTFPSAAHKSVNTPLRSVRIPPLRAWREGLADYCRSPALTEKLREWGRPA